MHTSLLGLRALATVAALATLGVLVTLGGAAGAPAAAKGGTGSGQGHSAQVSTTGQPPALSAEELKERLYRPHENENDRPPLTPVDPDAPIKHTKPAQPEAEVPAPRKRPAGIAAPGDFKIFRLTDLGSGNGSPINEPAVASNGAGMLVTWNWYAGISVNGGADFAYVNPYTQFPADYGGFCCDQVAYYVPSHDIYIWILQYTPDANENNALRLAVANGIADLQNGNWFYVDIVPTQAGALTGTNFDQPKVTVTDQHLLLEVTRYGATGGSVVLRMTLDDIANQGNLSWLYYLPGLFSPGFAQGGTDQAFFAAHVSNAKLRIFIWPDDQGFGGITTHDFTHAAHPVNYPMSCPRTGGSATSDWCRRRSFGGGWAHTDRIFAGWLANGSLGFAWDGTQGAGGLGTFNYPYVHIVEVNPGTYAKTNDQAIFNNDYAFSYFSVHPNAQGSLGATFMYGGGTLYQTCGAAVKDGYSGGAWEYKGLVASNADPDDTLSGDYLSTRKNGGTENTWSATCYAHRDGGDSGSVHTYYVSFGRDAFDPFRTLSIDFQGAGSGSVSGLPGNMTCADDCTALYTNGTMTNISATPGSGSAFAGWSGPCSGTSACDFAMTTPTTLVATFNDAQAPSLTAFVKPGRAIQRLRNFDVTWSATDNSGVVAAYDIEVQSARYDQQFAPYQSYQLNTPLTTSKFAGKPGYTYCFRGRARDAAGNESAFGPRRCTSIPIDDKRLAIEQGAWTRQSGTGYYLGSYTETNVNGATLRRADLKVRRIALMATVCPGCGRVDVYFNSTKLGTVDLNAPTMKKRVLFKLAEWFAIHTGTVRIVVTSSGKPVQIDGLGASKRRNTQ